MAFIKVPKLCRSVLPADWGSNARLHERRFHMRPEQRPRPIGLESAFVWTRKSPGWWYGVSSFHFQSMSAISEFMGIGLREISVLHGG